MTHCFQNVDFIQSFLFLLSLHFRYIYNLKNTQIAMTNQKIIYLHDIELSIINRLDQDRMTEVSFANYFNFAIFVHRNFNLKIVVCLYEF